MTRDPWVKGHPSHRRAAGAEVVLGPGRSADLGEERHVLVEEELEAEVATSTENGFGVVHSRDGVEHLHAATSVNSCKVQDDRGRAINLEAAAEVGAITSSA